MTGTKIWFLWNDPTLVWDTTDYTWSEAYYVQHVAAALGGDELFLPKDYDTWKKFQDELRKKKISEKESLKFLEVVVKVNGIDTREIRELEELKKTITAEHIKNTFAAFKENVKVSVVKKP